MEIFSIETLVYTVAFAVVLAMVYYFFMQRITSEAAEKLILSKADSKESAKTLDELGFSGIKKKLAKRFLSGGNMIAKAVESVKTEDENDKKESADLLFKKETELKYYIPGENNGDKLKKHLKDKLSVFKLILAALIVAASAFVFSNAARFLENYAKNVFSRKVIPTPTGIAEQNDTGAPSENGELTE
ncbi:MAG: hypothetical protein J5844_03970 [Clostridia bacterium]|nr:hypothetical protein [Clostridia bacterium]